MGLLLPLSLFLNVIVFTHGCGEDLGNRIVGGSPTDPHEIPWQVGLVSGNNKRPFCGGTIICSRYVMTAAHCLGGSFKVLAQEHNLNDNSDGTRHNIARYIRHPNYNGNTLDNDYALLELAEPLDLTGDSKARAACLPTAADITFGSGTSFVVSGWGARTEGGGSPNVLHAVTVPHVSDAQCNTNYNGDITGQMICAGQPAGGIDSCQGDSGGPLTWVDPTTSKVKLIGVVSWGIGCARPNKPGVYAEVSSVLPWVESIIGDCANVDPGTDTTTVGPNPTTTAGPNPTTTAGPNPTTTAGPNPTNAPTECAVPSWHDDNWCDDVNNTAECNWDGGDCCPCTNSNPNRNRFCDDCECLDPNAPALENIWSDRRCRRVKRRGNCGRPRPQEKCKKTCEVCEV